MGFGSNQHLFMIGCRVRVVVGGDISPTAPVLEWGEGIIQSCEAARCYQVYFPDADKTATLFECELEAV